MPIITPYEVASSDEEFIHMFADVLMNEFETMRSQFAQYMCIV